MSAADYEAYAAAQPEDEKPIVGQLIDRNRELVARAEAADATVARLMDGLREIQRRIAIYDASYSDDAGVTEGETLMAVDEVARSLLGSTEDTA